MINPGNEFLELQRICQNLESRVSVLERQIKPLRQQVRDTLMWLDIHCSPPWKRVWWWMCGFKFYGYGRWPSRLKNWRNRDGY